MSVILHQLAVRKDVRIVRLNVCTTPSALHAGVSEGVPSTAEPWGGIW